MQEDASSGPVLLVSVLCMLQSQTYLEDVTVLILLHVALTTKAVSRQALRFSAPMVWQSIPQNIRLSSSVGSFKRNLKTYLFSLPG